VEWARQRWGHEVAERLAAARLSYAVAVSLVYVALWGVLIVAAFALVPVIVNQSIQLGASLPGYLAQVPTWLNSWQQEVARRFDVDPNLLSQLYKPEEIARQITDVGPRLVQDTLTMISGIASMLGELMLVLVISYYMMLDGRAVSQQFYRLVPRRYQDEVKFAAQMLDKTFGGFLRGQVLTALIEGVATSIAAGLAGLPYGAVIGAICGLIMFIPLIGSPIAMVLPSIIAMLWGNTSMAIGLFVFIAIFQQILVNIVIPRIVSQSIGMPSLLIFVSVLVGVRMLGGWGGIFAIPVAAAIYAVGVTLLERYKMQQDRLDADQRQSPNDGGQE
jgi:predicted PurR-regulated permease PerM